MPAAKPTAAKPTAVVPVARAKPAMLNRHAPEGMHPLARMHTPVRRISANARVQNGQNPSKRA